MLHNDGPYGPNEASDNLGPLVNIGPIGASSNIPINMNNLDKIGQQPAQDLSARYHLPDFSSYNHPNLSMSPQLSAYPGYSPMGFQPSYPPTNTTSAHNASWHSGMLPPHLNQHPFHNQNMLNYPIQYQRTSQNQGYCDTNIARNMSINYPQVPAKQQKVEIEPDCSTYEVNQRKYDDYANVNSDSAPKITEKPLLDSTKRKNLENTVRLIEDILSSTAKNREMQKNQMHCNNSSQSKLYDSLTAKEQKKVQETVIRTDYTNSRNKNQDSSNTSNLTYSKPTDYYEDDKVKSESYENSSKRNDSHNIPINYSENETTNNNEKRDDSPERKNNSMTTNTGRENSTILKMEQESSLEKVPFIKVEVETDDSYMEKEMSSHIDVKVEPIFWHNMEYIETFQRDVHGKTSDEVGMANVIDGDNTIVAATDAIKTGIPPHAFYECVHCGLLFRHPKRFLVHIKWHSFGLTNEKRTEIAREKQMWREQRKEERVMNKKMVSKDKVKPEPNREIVTSPCKDCDKVFRSKSSLKNHRHRYHPTRYFECEICKEQVLGSLALKAHVAAHSGDGPHHQCPDCDKRFVYAHSLTKHRATHLEKTLQCQNCPKKFGTNSQLKMHQKVHERAVRGTTFRCSYCAKGFYESYNLMVHERTHRGERPYLCDICNTSYGTNSSLKRHLKVSHSTSKPFECSTCHRSFAAESTRDRHQIRAHGDPEEMNYHCQLCGNRYLHQRDLTKHVYKAHKKGKKKKVSDSE